jgi:hypothetical protein
MPLVNRQVTLSNTVATEIVGHDNMPHEVILHNMTKSSNNFVHYGNASMSLTNSPHIDPGETLKLTLRPGDRLYAMSDPNGLVVGVLDIRKND